MDTVLIPRPPPLKQASRLSAPFRRINQRVGTITHLDIFIGSLTGTSERLAASLAAKAMQRGAVVTLKSLEHFDPDWLGKCDGGRLIIFVVSTHFAGGPSPSAEGFSQWLRLASEDRNSPTVNSVLCRETRPTGAIQNDSEVLKPFTTPAQRWHGNTIPKPAERPRRQNSFSSGGRPRMIWRNVFNRGAQSKHNSLRGVQYAVFGVGHSMYLTYNAMGKFVDARMRAIGAVRLCPLGLGDVSRNIDEAFEKWEAHILHFVVYQKSGPPVGMVEDFKQIPLPQRRITSVGELSSRQFDNQIISSSLPLQQLGPESLRIQPQPGLMVFTRNHELRSDLTISGPTRTPTTVAGKRVIQDRYGRPVRLRFRCRYIEGHSLTRCGQSSKLPFISRNEGKTSYKLSRRHSLIEHDTTHIRSPCIALQSMTMLQQITAHGECQDPPPPPLKEVTLARLVILDPDTTFETADTFGYFPSNSKPLVEAVGEKFRLDMDAYVELSCFDDASNTTEYSTSVADNNNNIHLPFPRTCRVRTLLSDFLELRVISREFVRVAAGFVTDPKEHELLESLASIDGSEAFNREFGHVNCGVLRLLELAPSLWMSFEVLVNITPLIKPRLYVIASSHVTNDREFEIAVALGDPNELQGAPVSNFRRVMSKQKIQVRAANNTAVSKESEASVPFMRLFRGFIATSRFKIPIDLSAPMVMIAQGLGIAPFRALLQHRAFDVAEHEKNLTVPEKLPEDSNGVRTSYGKYGKNLLLLGCSSNVSILFESELCALKDKGLLEFHVVHSTKPGQTVQRIQDIVTTKKDTIASLMASSQEARIYVSGKVAMTRAVNQILSAPGTANSTNTWYEKALQSGRYIEGIYG